MEIAEETEELYGIAEETEELLRRGQ